MRPEECLKCSERVIVGTKWSQNTIRSLDYFLEACFFLSGSSGDTK